jgi:hypothetical protein
VIEFADEQAPLPLRVATLGVVAHDLQHAGLAIGAQSHGHSASPKPGPVLSHVPAFVSCPSLAQRLFDFPIGRTTLLVPAVNNTRPSWPMIS